MILLSVLVCLASCGLGYSSDISSISSSSSSSSSSSDKTRCDPAIECTSVAVPGCRLQKRCIITHHHGKRIVKCIGKQAPIGTSCGSSGDSCDEKGRCSVCDASIHCANECMDASCLRCAINETTGARHCSASMDRFNSREDCSRRLNGLLCDGLRGVCFNGQCESGCGLRSRTEILAVSQPPACRTSGTPSTVLGWQEAWSSRWSLGYLRNPTPSSDFELGAWFKFYFPVSGNFTADYYQRTGNIFRDIANTAITISTSPTLTTKTVILVDATTGIMTLNPVNFNQFVLGTYNFTFIPTCVQGGRVVTAVVQRLGTCRNTSCDYATWWQSANGLARNYDEYNITMYGVVTPRQDLSAVPSSTVIYGNPIVLFDGTIGGTGPLDYGLFNLANIYTQGFQVQSDSGGYFITNQDPIGNFLFSFQQFWNFRVQLDYSMPVIVGTSGNSGLFLRGRYEIQLDNTALTTGPTRNYALYSRVAALNNPFPAAVNNTPAARIIVDLTLTDFTLSGTVSVNGAPAVPVHNNSWLEGITGGFLDMEETCPGSIAIQNHQFSTIAGCSVTNVIKIYRLTIIPILSFAP